MKKWIIIPAIVLFFNLNAHCQMPCGIYHDEMVFEMVDQYVETMVKGVTVLGDNKFANNHDRNEFVRWINAKDKMSDDTANLLMEYFLQQKIKPDEPDTDKKLKAIHRLLFLLVQIKQEIEIKKVQLFNDEWERFKLFFHIEGYECAMEKKNLKIWDEKKKQYIDKPANEPPTHQELHDQNIPHTH